MKKKRSTSRQPLEANGHGMPVYNLESGRPILDEARLKLSGIIETERRRGTKALKIIHGWGSSGVGGVLRVGLRNFLQSRKREGGIREFIPGEDLSLNVKITDVLKDHPGLSSDPDFGRGNPGVTIIIIS